jgi:hypothetical protein
MSHVAPVILTVVTALLVTLQVPSAQQRAQAIDIDLVGTWMLVSIEQDLEASTPRRVTTPRGVLILDAAGYVFEYVTHASPAPMPGGAALSQAQRTLATSGGFWGRYEADAAQQRITLRPNAGLTPNLAGRELTRTFERTNDRLAITGTAAEPYTEGATRWTWERVPSVDNLSPTYRALVGFWENVGESRVNLTTGDSTSSVRGPSLIVYTPSGYVGVHFAQPQRQPFAQHRPSESEAAAAIKGYIGYFGALNVYPGFVFHQVLGGVSPTMGSTLQRFYELSSDGDAATIKLPTAGQAETRVHLRRLSGIADLLPER